MLNKKENLWLFWLISVLVSKKQTKISLWGYVCSWIATNACIFDAKNCSPFPKIKKFSWNIFFLRIKKKRDRCYFYMVSRTARSCRAKFEQELNFFQKKIWGNSAKLFYGNCCWIKKRGREQLSLKANDTGLKSNLRESWQYLTILLKMDIGHLVTQTQAAFLTFSAFPMPTLHYRYLSVKDCEPKDLFPLIPRLLVLSNSGLPPHRHMCPACSQTSETPPALRPPTSTTPRAHPCTPSSSSSCTPWPSSSWLPRQCSKNGSGTIMSRRRANSSEESPTGQENADQQQSSFLFRHSFRHRRRKTVFRDSRAQRFPSSSPCKTQVLQNSWFLHISASLSIDDSW